MNVHILSHLCLPSILIIVPTAVAYGSGAAQELDSGLQLPAHSGTSHVFKQLLRELTDEVPAFARLEGHVYTCLGRIALTTNGPALLEAGGQAWAEVTAFNYDYDDLDDYLKANGLPSVKEFFNGYLLGLDERRAQFMCQKIRVLAQHDPEFRTLVVKCFSPALHIPAVQEFLALLKPDVEVTDAVLDLLVSATRDLSDWVIDLLWSLPLDDAWDPNFDHKDFFEDAAVAEMDVIGREMFEEMAKLYPHFPLAVTWARSFWAVYVKLLVTEEGRELGLSWENAINFIKAYTFNFTELNGFLTQAGLETADEFVAKYTKMLAYMLQDDADTDAEGQDKAVKEWVDDPQLLAAHILQLQTYLLKLREMSLSDPEFAAALWTGLEPFAMAADMLRFYKAVADPTLYGFYVELGVALLKDTREYLTEELEGMKGGGELWAKLAGKEEL